MARNFSDSPKEYKKLRCYSKDDNPFYIRHDTFITNSDIEVTENSSENSEQSLKIKKSNEIVKTRNAPDDKENKLESERENEVEKSVFMPETTENYIDKQEKQEQHDIEEIMWETKTFAHKETQLKSEEMMETDDSSTDLEEENSRAIEKIFLFCKNKNLDKQDQIEQKKKTDKSNTKLEGEELDHIDKSFLIFRSEGNNSDRQEQLEQQDIEGIIQETKITTHRETQFKYEGENETDTDTLTKLKEGDLEQIEEKEKYKAEGQDQSLIQHIKGKILKKEKIAQKENKFKTEESYKKDLSVTEFEEEDLEQIEESLVLSHYEKNPKVKQYQLEQQDINSLILETETTTHSENKFEPEQTNKTDSVTKMEVEDLEQIEESFSVGQTEESCSDKQESSELQDTEDIIWETEVTTNSVKLENGLEFEKGQENELNSKVFEFSAVFDKDHDSDEYKDILEEEEYKSMSILKIEALKSKTLLKEASVGVNQGIEKLVGETSFGCLLEIDRDNGENSPTDNQNSDLKGIFRLKGILDIEKMNENDIFEWEDENLSSEDEGFHELSLSINVGNEETNSKPVITNLLETMCGDIGSLAQFDVLNIDEDKVKPIQDGSKENKSMIHNKESKYKFNCTVELETNSEDGHECEKTEDGEELGSYKEEISQLKEANVQNETEANGNIYPLKHFHKPDELKMDYADNEENGKDTEKNVTANVDIFDISDKEVVLEQLSACLENEPLNLWNLEANQKAKAKKEREDFIEEIAYKVAESDKRVEDRFTEVEALALWKLEASRIAKAKKEREAFIEEIAYKVAESDKRVEDRFTEVVALALWKLEADKIAKAKKEREAFIEEIAYKVTKSQAWIDQIFTEIESLAILKLDNIRKEEEDNKREIEMSPDKTQDFRIERKKEYTKKDTTISPITESAANAQKKERNMKIEQEFVQYDLGIKDIEEICFISKDETVKLQNQLFPKTKMETRSSRETTENPPEKPEIFEETRQKVKEGNKGSLVDAKDAEEIVIIHTNDTQEDCSRDWKHYPKEALKDISTKQEQLSEETTLDQHVTCLLPILSMLWFICLLLKLFQDEIKLQHEQGKKSSDYKYFDILEWP